MANTIRSFVALLFLVLGLTKVAPLLSDETASAPPAILPAEDVSTKEPTYTLAYKLTAGDEIRTKVLHLVTVDTEIKKVSQTAKTRSISSKLWTITSVDEAGTATFVHSVEHVEMWQGVSGRQEVKFDSRTDKSAPPGYEHVMQSVGIPLATITMDKYGRVLSRKDAQPQFNPGIGELSIPLPAQPVRVGQRWSIPDEIKVKLDDGTVKKISTRQVYRLDSVMTGVATISVETQVLTPVNDPKIQSQLVQRMQKGLIKFDVDAGKLIYKQMDLNEQVIGFNGPDSVMKYLARFTEEPAQADSPASSNATAEAAKPAAGPAPR